MPRTPAAPTALAALCALFAVGAGPSALAAPPVVFDANDNPITPAIAAPRTVKAGATATDPFPFDANDNPLSLPSSSPTRRVRQTVALRRTVSAIPPTVAEKANRDITVRPSPNPLKASATALFRDGDRLYLGLHDGGIAFCDAGDGGHGGVVRFTEPTLPVRALVAERGVVWWVSGDGATVYQYQQENKSVTAYVVGDPAAGWVQRIALLDGNLYLCGDHLTRVLDPATGALRPPIADDGLPANALRADGMESLYVAGGDVALVASANTLSDASQPRVWRSERPRRQGRDWREIASGSSDTSTPPSALLIGTSPRHATRSLATLRLDVESGGCAALADPTGIHLLSTLDSNADPQSADIPFGCEPGMPTALDRFTVGASGAWWLMHGTLFHAAPDGLHREAYLPWNSARGAQVQALLPDAHGVYIALDRGGVRHLTPDAPSLTDGYAGYVLARLGDENCEPAPGAETDVAAAIEDWQGVPYRWGGQTKAGTDCSGFVGAVHKTVGVTIPRSTAEMTASSQGRRILDELHYGDVLVYPGHCALYIGNGRTAETVAAQVSKASIWRRTDVVVKRYLP